MRSNVLRVPRPPHSLHSGCRGHGPRVNDQTLWLSWTGSSEPWAASPLVPKVPGFSESRVSPVLQGSWGKGSLTVGIFDVIFLDSPNSGFLVLGGIVLFFRSAGTQSQGLTYSRQGLWP